jgi:hypothetical protein
VGCLVCPNAEKMYSMTPNVVMSAAQCCGLKCLSNCKGPNAQCEQFLIASDCFDAQTIIFSRTGSMCWWKHKRKVSVCVSVRVRLHPVVVVQVVTSVCNHFDVKGPVSCTIQ